MDQATILLVEDEERLARNLVRNLEADAYLVQHAATCAEAEALVADNEAFDLIILDRMLPDGEGIDLASAWRDQGLLMPILMLTARNAVENVVEGLAAGADDYVGKPFAIEELLGRVQALLRRAGLHKAPRSRMLQVGIHQIDLESGKCTSDKGKRQLTSLELRLVRYFARRPNQAITREDLLQAVWQIDEPDKVRSRTIDTFMVRLRKYFEADPGQPEHFLTEHGSGYRFLPNEPK